MLPCFILTVKILFISCRKILQKYAYDENPNNTKKKENDRNKPTKYTHISNDPFYDVLKKRVYNELSSHNIHPDNDRCATYKRMLYYVFIFTSLCISLYWHIHVSVRNQTTFLY